MSRKLILKGAVNKLLVEERKKMREAQKESKFKQRTLNIYKNQVVRAKELGEEVYYTLGEFRNYLKSYLGLNCPYCHSTKLSVANFVCDHADPVSRGGQFTLTNEVACCKNCNWQKGKLNWKEFHQLNTLLSSFPDEVSKDVRQRLSIGGKWTGRMRG